MWARLGVFDDVLPRVLADVVEDYARPDTAAILRDALHGTETSYCDRSTEKRSAHPLRYVKVDVVQDTVNGPTEIRVYQDDRQPWSTTPTLVHIMVKYGPIPYVESHELDEIVTFIEGRGDMSGWRLEVAALLLRELRRLVLGHERGRPCIKQNVPGWVLTD